MLDKNILPYTTEKGYYTVLLDLESELKGYSIYNNITSIKEASSSILSDSILTAKYLEEQLDLIFSKDNVKGQSPQPLLKDVH